ncbi:MAG TPA: CPBP family intramembrane glutamic endopeptidase, partial [Chroococcales cyanobacterium]
LQTLLKGMEKYRAILISAGIWGIAHFLHPGLSFPESLVSMLGLWTAGILLGYAYTSTRSLWTPIGIHAGWIYFISVSGQMNVFSFTRGGALFHGNGSPTSGILGLALTALFLLLFLNVDSSGEGRPST